MSEKSGIDKERELLAVDLSHEDALGVVIRGHIRIEGLLVRYIDAKLPNPQHIEDQNFGYYERTSLAISLGLREDLKGPLRALGKIRNQFAHTPDVAFSENQYKDFVSAFSKKDKEVFEKSLAKVAADSKTDVRKFTHRDLFRFLITTLWAACRAEVFVIEESAIE